MTPGKPEEIAREDIDAQLVSSGWVVQDMAELNLAAACGVAVREYPMAKGHGKADYLLFVDGQAVGALEAKKVGHTLTGVEGQAVKYGDGVPRELDVPVRPLPFLYVSTGVETEFTNRLDPEPRSRRVFAPHRPETIQEWLQADILKQWVKGWTPMAMAAAEPSPDAYEGLLERNAQDVKSGAGQYFTPRSLIEAIVEVIRPKPGEVTCDPACGTGGFLLATHGYLAKQYKLDKNQKKHLRYDALRGIELVEGVGRLCAMNLFLHGIGPDDAQADVPIDSGRDSLRSPPKDLVDIVLTNPPFGKKSSITVVTEEGDTDKQAITYNRTDFWTTTSNKQLNFVQHVKSLLKMNGRAAVVVPDNVLFEGGAGEKIRRKLMQECDLHTILRLPTGIFYAQGVKANVLFFDRKPARETAWTTKAWFYDLRTNHHFTLKQSRLSREDLDEFVKVYNPENRHERKPTWSERKPEGRWRAYTYDEIVARDKASLDIFWLRDESIEDSANLPEPHVLAEEIADDLRASLEQMEDVLADLQARAVHLEKPTVRSRT